MAGDRRLFFLLFFSPVVVRHLTAVLVLLCAAVLLNVSCTTAFGAFLRG